MYNLKKITSILLMLLLVLSLASCNANKENVDTSSSSYVNTGNPVFDAPDFTQKPVANGTEIITTVDDMLNYIKQYNPAGFSFSDKLDKSEQTLYKNKDLSDDGTVLKNKVSVISAVPAYIKLLDVSDFQNMTVNDFDVSNDGTMYYLKDEKCPDLFQTYSIIDYSLDMTSRTAIIRGIMIVSSNMASTIYLTVTIQLNEDGSYTTAFVSQEYGNGAGTEYVLQSSESMTYTVGDDNEIVSGKYRCVQDTVIYSNDKYQSEEILIDINIDTVDDNYNITRKASIAQVNNSDKIEDTKVKYNATQTISFANGHYLLEEVATGYDDNNNATTETQYVLYS